MIHMCKLLASMNASVLTGAHIIMFPTWLRGHWGLAGKYPTITSSGNHDQNFDPPKNDANLTWFHGRPHYYLNT